MDNLALNAMLAKKAGLSYGKWKAMQPIVEIKQPEIPEGSLKCPGCGKLFIKRNKKQIYCEVECQRQTYKRTHREQILAKQRRYAERVKMREKEK